MPQQMGWRDAAIEVLKNEPDGISYTEIADRIIEQKLRATFGATPSGSVNVMMSDSIRYEPDTPFERVAPGRYRLRNAPSTAKPESSTANSESPEPAPEQVQQRKTTGLINALGMYWSRASIHWALPIPRLLGRQTQASEPVNFTDQRGVYLLYDRNEVVYVGRAIDQGIGTRLRQHITDRLGSRWDRFSWFGVYPVAESGALISDEPIYDQTVLIATMEALLIESVEPKQNRRRGDDFQAIEFLQVEDPDLEKQRNKSVLMQLADRLSS